MILSLSLYGLKKNLMITLWTDEINPKVDDS